MEQVCKHCGAILNTEYYRLHSANNADWLYCSGKCLDEFDKKIKADNAPKKIKADNVPETIKADNIPKPSFPPADINYSGLQYVLGMSVLLILSVCFGIRPFDIMMYVIDGLLSMLSSATCGMVG